MIKPPASTLATIACSNRHCRILSSAPQVRQVVVEFNLHPHRAGRRHEMRLFRKDEAGSLRRQALLVRRFKEREDYLALKDADYTPDAGLGAMITA